MTRACTLFRLVLIGLFGVALLVPGTIQAQEAEPSPGNAALASMLGNLPADAISNEQPVHFADLALQYDTLDLNTDAATLERLGAIWGLYPGRIWSGIDFLSVPENEADLESGLGFSFDQIDRAIGVQFGDDGVVLFQGSFDGERITAALTNTGYEWRQEDGVPVAQYGEDGEIDFATRAGMLVFNFGANTIAILPDGSLAFASTSTSINRVIAAAIDSVDSLLDRDDVQSLLAGFDLPLAGLTIFAGEDFASSCVDAELVRNPNLSPEGQADLATAFEGINKVTGVMPPSRLVAIGVTPGGPTVNLSSFRYLDKDGWPDARGVLLVLSVDDADAQTTLEVIRGRLEVGFSFSQIKPWRDLYATWFLHVDAGEPLVRIDLIAQPGEMPHWWDVSSMSDLTLPLFPSSAADCPDYLS